MFGNNFYFLFSKTCFGEYKEKTIFLYFLNKKCGGAKTWALALGLSLTFYQQYVRLVRGEEIMGEPRN